MTAAELLGQYNISTDDALNWILEHLDHPDIIYTTARSYGIDSAMLAEIVEPVVPGANAQLVENFFDSHGLDGASLSAEVIGSEPQEQYAILTDDYQSLLDLVSLNSYGGILSTESLRSEVISRSSESSYYDVFDPTYYIGGEDGVFTTEELGISSLGDIAATTENMESLYYGTFINAFKAIDMSEVIELSNFLDSHQVELSLGSEEAIQEYMNLILDMFEDPAENPVFTDEDIESIIVVGTAAVVNYFESGDFSSLFDGLVLI